MMKLNGDSVGEKICSVESCDRKVWSAKKSLCRPHFTRKKEYGDVMADKPINKHERHGKTKTPEYQSWRGMRERCLSPNYSKYSYYGGKGITFCNRWKVFTNFLEDMGKRPTKLHTLDRIDSNGNYCPENCRWATRMEQSHNSTVPKMININGENRCISEWTRIFKISRSTVKKRIRDGWPEDKWFVPPYSWNPDYDVDLSGCTKECKPKCRKHYKIVAGKLKNAP